MSKNHADPNFWLKNKQQKDINNFPSVLFWFLVSLEWFCNRIPVFVTRFEAKIRSIRRFAKKQSNKMLWIICSIVCLYFRSVRVASKYFVFCPLQYLSLSVCLSVCLSTMAVYHGWHARQELKVLYTIIPPDVSELFCRPFVELVLVGSHLFVSWCYWYIVVVVVVVFFFAFLYSNMPELLYQVETICYTTGKSSE